MNDTSPQKIPAHIAIIMDGNGRWAQRRGQPRTFGHRKGVDAIERSTRAAADLGVQYLTLFAFSTENWKRPLEEVNDLIHLMRFYLKNKLSDLHENNVCLKIIGDRTTMPDDLITLFDQAETKTRNNTGITLQIAISYSGRWDLTQAAQKLAAKVQNGELSAAEITEDSLAACLATANVPDPDLVIRTSGEQRISNFLLWQMAYSECYFTQTLWPDFGKDDLMAAILSFNQRERRFGQVPQAIARTDES